MIDRRSLFPEVLAEKRCRTCKAVKPVDAFPRDRKRQDGYQTWCKACKQEAQRRDYAADPMKMRERWLKSKFGITQAEFDELLESVGGACQICGRTEGASKWCKKEGHLAIDHVHTTGEMRGILCDSCNPGIGFFKDDPDLLEKAAAYLRDFETKRGAPVPKEPINVWKALWRSEDGKELYRWFTDTDEVVHRVFPTKRAALSAARTALSKRGVPNG